MSAAHDLRPRRPRSLFRSTIPFVYPSSGSVGDNGALSGITALPQQYPHAYFWMPANAIAAGSAAGWYYGVMSSTSAATLYDETYTTGVPAVPASPTAFATTGPGAYTQEVAAGKRGPQFTLPANTLGPNGKLRIEGVVKASTNATSKSFGIRVDDTTSIGSAVFNNIANGGIVGWIKALKSTVLQTAVVNLFGNSSLNGVSAQRAFDMTASHTLEAMLTLTAATEWMVLLDFEIVQEA